MCSLFNRKERRDFLLAAIAKSSQRILFLLIAKCAKFFTQIQQIFLFCNSDKTILLNLREKIPRKHRSPQSFYRNCYFLSWRILRRTFATLAVKQTQYLRRFLHLIRFRIDPFIFGIWGLKNLEFYVEIILHKKV